MSQQVSLKRPLPKVPMRTFTSLFCAVVSQALESEGDVEDNLRVLGREVGLRSLDLIVYRAKPGKRENSLVPMLQLITGPGWRALFGKPADALEKSSSEVNSYLIRERDSMVKKAISAPRGSVDVGAFVAGVVQGLLEAGGFQVLSATAHRMEDESTVYLIKFPQS